MGRFAKLSLKKFATLKHIGTLMAEIMILEGRLEVHDPPQYQACSKTSMQKCSKATMIQRSLPGSYEGGL